MNKDFNRKTRLTEEQLKKKYWEIGSWGELYEVMLEHNSTNDDGDELYTTCTIELDYEEYEPYHDGDGYLGETIFENEEDTIEPLKEVDKAIDIYNKKMNEEYEKKKLKEENNMKKELFENVKKAICSKHEVYDTRIDCEENTISFRFNDKYLTDELYNYGVNITNELMKELKDEIKIISDENYLKQSGMSFLVEECEKGWVDFILEIN